MMEPMSRADMVQFMTQAVNVPPVVKAMGLTAIQTMSEDQLNEIGLIATEALQAFQSEDFDALNELLRELPMPAFVKAILKSQFAVYAERVIP